MGTYELKFDPASQYSVPNGELEGLHQMFDKVVEAQDAHSSKHHKHHKQLLHKHVETKKGPKVTEEEPMQKHEQKHE